MDNINELDEPLIADLASLLEPCMRCDIRRKALEAVLGLSAHMNGSAERVFKSHDFVLAKALCTLCEATTSDRVQTLSAITNFTSLSAESAYFLLSERPVILRIAYKSIGDVADWLPVSTRLLSNVSRHFPGETFTILSSLDVNLLDTLLGHLIRGDGEVGVMLGFCIVNLASLPIVRRLLAQKQYSAGTRRLQSVYPLLQQEKDVERRRIAADLLRNCTFDDGLHADLLDETDDFLVALLIPLADADDDLDQEETDALPLRLQYYEGKRTQDMKLRLEILESLYQLCATKHGRILLRKGGVYPLLRELDRSSKHLPHEERKENKEIIEEENTLHALIGVLIRYESEMGIDPELATIRELE